MSTQQQSSVVGSESATMLFLVQASQNVVEAKLRSEIGPNLVPRVVALEDFAGEQSSINASVAASFQSARDESVANFASLQTSVLGLETSQNNMQTAQMALQSSLSSVLLDQTACQTSISTLQSQSTSLQSSVATLQSQSTSLQSSVATLQNVSTTLNANQSSLQTNQNSLQTNLTNIQNSLTSVQSRLTANETGLTFVINSTSDLQSQLQEQAATLADLVELERIRQENVFFANSVALFHRAFFKGTEWETRHVFFFRPIFTSIMAFQKTVEDFSPYNADHIEIILRERDRTGNISRITQFYQERGFDRNSFLVVFWKSPFSLESKKLEVTSEFSLELFTTTREQLEKRLSQATEQARVDDLVLKMRFIDAVISL
jgi:predicted  nucleic acid-binding Zn-ribbon protein